MSDGTFRRARRVGLGLAAVILSLAASPGVAQSLRFSNHRDVGIPDYATIRLGPFYSDVTLSQSVGVRWVRLSGNGTDFLASNERGEIREDGYDFPLVTTLGLRNYLIVSRDMDVEASVRVSYEHYPMGTQEDEFIVDFSDEGIFADLSTEFQPTRSTRMRIYDSAAYRTDFVDSRGLEDRYGGVEYERFENTVGADLDWLMSKLDNLSLSASRMDVVPASSDFDAQRHVAYAESAAYERQLSPYVVGGVRADFGQSLASDDTRPDSYREGLSVFSSAQVTKLTDVSASLGYAVASTRGGDPEIDESSGSISGSGRVRSRLSQALRHELEYTRAFSEAFEGGYDSTDAATYGLTWDTRALPGGISTSLRRYDPMDDVRPGYMDWITQLTVNQQVSRLVALQFFTSYGMRMNESMTVDDAVDTDLSADYDTWVTRLSTAIPLTRKLRLTAYAEHAVRTGDADELTYTRDILAANLVWFHRF